MKARIRCSLLAALMVALFLLIGQMRVETRFRALFLARSFRLETQLRARRGADLRVVAGRAPAS